MAIAHEDSPTGIATVVVPAAGMGTRFLPATKTVPKELLPVVDTPGIELIAEEAASVGAQRLAVITAPNKQEVMRHFEEFPELVDTLDARGKDEQVGKVKRAAQLIHPISVPQEKPLGLGHAVGLAESVLDDDEEYFAVMLPDDIVLPATVMGEMARVRAALGGSVLCAFEVSREETFNYGVFDVEDTNVPGVKKVVGMVEKPDPEDAPSNLVATGRYLLDRKIFDALRRIKPGKGGELQLTDAIELLITEGHPVHVVVHQGKRHDLGNPGGYIPANVDFGLRDEKYGPALYKAIKQIMDEYEAENGLKG
ncbi:UTP--glucose-1-phosphate uridylyltransferase [Corynebacterium minutissimum]|uniref:UTP--glucose-1-phosphate uridylyltransferase n=1 Tax=Corynebacterium minutissimum TaxID=38301 RepID=A0A2X4UCV4_9CORY|nr:UTP--glucose-1-phosphate uridylyltransferase [Corynebacterium minutissimum]KHO29740.1 UDP-glucose pyrophosphorylase [Corynebacterium minutissimum]MCG7229316.1 UTP--glucose-1-phosphate uridylyltransferase [Corynebacterium minutissimum]MCG7238306.1 UTP--glucose-1-phosphate uridylyltransferase [Corynebacterium minutissimum]QPS60722.1 UTP--glucose-1-phosphate uridylyltransferase [Corynebacterium minutissimum]QQA78491.1 UTP--glucose-1-phosphate uridylyltransferase [Corynebacterium minutissimum]